LDDIHADVWHAHALADARVQVVATGDAGLDAQLPGGGWPLGALTEILQPQALHSEWRLLLHALARCGHGPVVLVGAPYAPFVQSLQAGGLASQRLLWVAVQESAARLWAAEQALRCAQVDAVLAWLPQARSAQLRRLHIAAAEHHKLLFVLRPEQVRNEASPAGLRLHVAPAGSQLMQAGMLAVEVFKRKGPPLDQPLLLPAQSASLAVLLHASVPRSRHALDRTAA
jgi:protein ImuA